MFDEMRALVGGRGVDSRQWGSYGQVIGSSTGSQGVRFNDPTTGQPLQHGVLVDVKLEPSGHVVACRVLNSCAGNGESEYHPFVPGDEVYVLIPEGDEHAGCVIIGRLNNQHDVFPQKVAGMDATSNTFGFKRHVMPFVVEVGGGYMIRQATTHSAFSIDQTGQIFLTEGGTGAQLVLTPDVVGLVLNGSTAGFQIDVQAGIVLVSANTASLVLDDAAGSKWQSSSVLSVSTCGNPGLNHVATVEGVLQLLMGFCAALAVDLVGVPVAGTALAALIAPGSAMTALFEQAILLASTEACGFAPLIGAIQTALLTPKVPFVNAGIGSPGFLCD